MSKTPPSAQPELPFIVYKIWVISEIRSSVLMIHVQGDRVQKDLSSLRLLLCVVIVTEVTHTSIGLRWYWMLRSVGWSMSYRRFGIIYRLHIQGSSSHKKITQWRKIEIPKVHN